MKGKTHFAAGLFTGSAALVLSQNVVPELSTLSIGLVTGVTTTLFTAASARLPDIDEKNSTIGRRLWFISWPIYILKWIVNIICLIPTLFGIRAFRNISQAVDHRGFTHYPATWLVITFFSSLYGFYVYGLRLSACYRLLLLAPAIGLVLGILSHILLDLISGKIALLAPFSFKRYGIVLIAYNSILEHIFRLGLYLATVKICIEYYGSLLGY